MNDAVVSVPAQGTAEDYTGLAAAVWDVFSGGEPGRDHAFFERAVTAGRGPALDVGCGSGRLLRPFLRAGLEVEGVDPSADILAICRCRAEAEGISPVLYQQRMQTLDLPRVYRTIFVPCGSFQLVVDRTEAFEALRRFRGHLEPGGTLILTVFNRWQEMADERMGEWTLRKRHPLADGTELVKEARVERQNLLDQTLSVTVRYRRERDGQILEEQISPTTERWYFVHELTLMLEAVGFRDIRVTGDYTDEPPTDESGVLAFFASV